MAFFGTKIQLWKVLVGFVAVLLLAAVTLTSFAQLAGAKRAALNSQLQQVQTGILSYYTEYYVMPRATNIGALVRELEGDNPRHIWFAAFKPSDLNTAGELLDPWGTPLRVTRDAVEVHITSAGPDQTFGTADDVQTSVDLDPSTAPTRQ